MKLFLFFLFVAFSVEEDLALLDSEFNKTQEYDLRYEQQIDSLRSLRLQGDRSFRTCLGLFDHYASYQFDSAYSYVCQLEQIAQAGNKDEEQVTVSIKKAFAYMSAGLFKEANEALDQVEHLDRCSQTLQAKYYSIYARLCFDLGSYTEGVFYDQYTHKAITMLEKEIALLTEADSAEFFYAQALRAMKMEDYVHALRYFEDCSAITTLTNHEKAIIYSSMAYPAQQLGDDELAMHYMILAAIADIRGSVKECIALRMVASMLHARGDSENALRYIEYAKQTASYYGARHRQMEISYILPIIEEDYMNRLKQHNRRIHALSAFSLVLLIICLVALILYHKRNQALAEARRTIEQMNTSLLLANKVKEEYIASFLCWQSTFINEVEKYQRHVRRVGELHRIEDLRQVPRHADATRSREEFDYRFDEMFLHIFPSFVSEFNALLRPDEQIRLQKGELLNTSLRIFALIRLGITQNEVIAAVLNYSVNTIYAYKTKIKAKSDLSTEMFYERVMSIPSH